MKVVSSVSKTFRRSSVGQDDVAPEEPLRSSAADESVRFRVVRLLVLIVIAVQNCSLMMVTGYSRSLPGPRYLASTAVVAGELVKTIVVFTALLYQHGPCGVQQVILSDVLSRKSQTGRFAIPAFFYTVQNNLWYYAMSNLDPVTAAVTSQLKVLSTAVFSVLILQKQLSKRKWVALGQLVFGLVVMQLPSAGEGVDGGPGGGADDIAGTGDGNHNAMGLLCMVAACTSSGYAGVYLERLFKELNVSIWISNMQLQVFCMPIAMLTVLSDLKVLQEDGFLLGWDQLTCVVVLLNALGGFAVSLTMKYADNILKTFAVSVSLVMNCVLSSLFMSVQISQQAMVGVALVILSTWLYSSGAPSGGSSREDSASNLDGGDLPQEGILSSGDLEMAMVRSSSVQLGGSSKLSLSPVGRAAQRLQHVPPLRQPTEAVALGRSASSPRDDEELRELLSEGPARQVSVQGAAKSPTSSGGPEGNRHFLTVNSMTGDREFDDERRARRA